MKKTVLALQLILLSVNVFSQDQSFQLRSPDKKLLVNIESQEEPGTISYDLFYDGKAVILKSKFGLECDEQDWSLGVTIKSTADAKKDTVWLPVYGERSSVRDNYNEKTFSLFKEDASDRDLSLTVRAYNEGIAFRYQFVEPQKVYGSSPLHITAETTEFTLPENSMAWYTKKAQTLYSLLPLSNWPGESDRPLTLELSNGLFVALTEAQMVNYSRTKLKLSETKANTILGSMYGCVDELPPLNTPWRVVLVADTPGELLENNDLILNLNKPCEIENTSWIKPGKVMRLIKINTADAFELVDFAVERNLQFIDLTFWNGDDITYNANKADVAPRHNSTGLDLEEVLKYAKSKDIGVWLYINIRPLVGKLDTLLPLYKSWGIAGIKFGFVHVGPHRWTTWVHDAVIKCAKYQIMVDLHDEYRPTGFSRTYPNLLTQEGIYGNECMPDATHNTILPFTRFIAGAADYTMCYYSARKEAGRTSHYIQCTPAHQLALPVIYYSPLQYLYWYDSPEHYQGEPEIAFWDAVPTVWDETRVLSGEIGKFISMARRSGDEWFIGSITNTEAREISIDLSFLESGKKFEAMIYSDDPDKDTQTHVGLKKMKVSSKTILSAKLLASGGQSIHIRPLNKNY